MDSINDIKNNQGSENNLLNNIEIPQINSDIDFFGTNNEVFENKKIDYENKNNVSSEVLNEFNQLNGGNIRVNNKDKFNFFSDAEENE